MKTENQIKNIIILSFLSWTLTLSATFSLKSILKIGVIMFIENQQISYILRTITYLALIYIIGKFATKTIFKYTVSKKLYISLISTIIGLFLLNVCITIFETPFLKKYLEEKTTNYYNYLNNNSDWTSIINGSIEIIKYLIFGVMLYTTNIVKKTTHNKC